MLRSIFFLAAVAASANGQNLICNGSFESPQLVADSTFTDLPCWRTTGGEKIEVQRKSLAAVSNVIGSQYVELDGLANSDIYQDIPTVVGQRYLIRFWVANRIGSSRSAFKMLWDGQLAGTAVRAAGETTFIRVNAEVVATKAVSRFGLAADGPSEGLGDLVDDISVTPIPAAGSRLGWTYYFPHYAHGGGWASSISLVNTSPTGFFAATVEKSVFADDGTELEAKQTLVLNPAGSTIIESTPPAVLKSGWVRIVSTEPLQAALIFRNILPGRFDLEATVPAREATTETTAPFDNTGFTTGLALANPGDAAITLTFTFRDASGTVFLTTSAGLGALTHTAFALADKFPQAAGRKGSLLIAATNAAGNPVSFLPLGLRFTPGGAFTTLPY